MKRPLIVIGIIIELLGVVLLAANTYRTAGIILLSLGVMFIVIGISKKTTTE
jgi:membrane-bound ClpP family serine protease